jgi:hypothetical protein
VESSREAHFAYVLNLLQNSFENRDGYTSFIGMPENGNPFGSINTEDLYLIEKYDAPQAVKKWFEDRGDILFVYHPSAWTIERLETHFEMYELIIQCRCGELISGRVSVFLDIKLVRCPKCGRYHETGRERAFKFKLEAPTETEEEYLNSARQRKRQRKSAATRREHLPWTRIGTLRTGTLMFSRAARADLE